MTRRSLREALSAELTFLRPAWLPVASVLVTIAVGQVTYRLIHRKQLEAS
jgi:hypothetical protein